MVVEDHTANDRDGLDEGCLQVKTIVHTQKTKHSYNVTHHFRSSVIRPESVQDVHTIVYVCVFVCAIVHVQDKSKTTQSTHVPRALVCDSSAVGRHMA